ncbi:MAG: nucleotidyltransferase domain-containing protein [Mucilaginibacter sp.]
MLHPIIQTHLPSITKVFKENKIKSAYAFGSVIGNNFNEESDIDLLINFEEGIESVEKGRIWWNIHDTLRDIFNREVDLLVETSLKNPYLIEDINEKKQLIYAA